MISTRQLAAALYGVWLLLRFDLRAWDYFELKTSGFWRAFTVAVVMAPLHFTHVFLTYDPVVITLGFVPYLVTEALAYIILWFAFPFAMLYLVQLLDREPRYFAYMVPYLWFQLPAWLLQDTITLLADLQLLQPQSAGLASYVIMGAAVTYANFIARAGLRVSVMAAIGLVILDVLITVAISTAVARI